MNDSHATMGDTVTRCEDRRKEMPDWRERLVVVFPGTHVFEVGDADSDVTRIECPNAVSVSLYGFESLDSFSAPQARHVDIEHVESLRLIDAPLVEEFRLDYADNITELNIPQATVIDIQWSSVAKITAPLVQDVNLRHCHDLSEFEMPLATAGEVVLCHELFPESGTSRLTPKLIDGEHVWTA